VAHRWLTANRLALMDAGTVEQVLTVQVAERFLVLNWQS